MSEPIRAQQVSSPLDTPGYFVAGIVKGYLVSSGFQAECDLLHCMLWSPQGQRIQTLLSHAIAERLYDWGCVPDV